LQVIIVGMAVTSVPTTVSAQDRWNWELDADVAEPTSDLGSGDLSHGLGFGGTVSYVFTPKFGTYFGWDWQHFEVDTQGSLSRELPINDSRVDVDLEYVTVGVSVGRSF